MYLVSALHFDFDIFIPISFENILHKLIFTNVLQTLKAENKKFSNFKIAFLMKFHVILKHKYSTHQ